MTEQEALAKMVAPGQRRSGKWRDGVIQICVTSICDKACFHCTQASQIENGERGTMTPEQFEQAVLSLQGYFGVVGVFGGNPATSKHFVDYCEILRKHVPFEQRGLWCNNPINVEKGAAMRATFNPAVSNLNVHLDKEAWKKFKTFWPESMPFGLDKDSRHSPPFVAMRDVLRKRCDECAGFGEHASPLTGTSGHEEDSLITCEKCNGSGKVYDEGRAWELISGCDINQHWSAMLGLFRGQLRAWFCEIAGAQAMLHQHEPDYPDTGLSIMDKGWSRNDGGGCGNSFWWELPMQPFTGQVRKHCHECSVPLRGHGELAQSDKGCEQVSQTHARVYQPKRRGRPVQLVERLEQLGTGRLATGMVTRYIQNA